MKEGFETRNCNVPRPVKLNCWKHHADFINKELRIINKNQQLKNLKTILLKIGESQMDLYNGKCSPKEIAVQILEYLISFSIKNNNEYKDWLYKDGGNYQYVEISDNSVWVLRLGDEKSRYVHIHPGRYSPLTIRVKALTLKTTICVLAYAKIKSVPVLDLNVINAVRKNYLGASALKSVNPEFGLGRLITLFSNIRI